MSREIRQASPADSEIVTGLVRGAYRIYLDRMDREPAPMTADYACLISAGHVTVLSVDDVIVGALIAYPRQSHFHVETVAVAPQAQGQGVGRDLMAHAELLARAARRDAIELYTNEVMTENLPFYAKLGYRITGRAQEDGFSRIFFRKALTDSR